MLAWIFHFFTVRLSIITFIPCETTDDDDDDDDAHGGHRDSVLRRSSTVPLADSARRSMAAILRKSTI